MLSVGDRLSYIKEIHVLCYPWEIVCRTYGGDNILFVEGGVSYIYITVVKHVASNDMFHGKMASLALGKYMFFSYSSFCALLYILGYSLSYADFDSRYIGTSFSLHRSVDVEITL